MKEKTEKFLQIIAGALYLPVYLAGWALHIIARLLLALAYLALGMPRMAKNVFKSLFLVY